MGLSTSLDHSEKSPYMVFQWALTVVLVFFGSNLLVVVYNLLLHPLKEFPGPPLARCTSLWGFYWNLHGLRAHKIDNAHKRYGTIIRIAPNLLSFSDPEAVREIYNSKNFVKAEGFYRAKRIFQENHLLSFRDPAQHHQRRKLLSRGFSQATLTEFEPQIASKVSTLLDQWTKLSKQKDAIDVYPWAHMFGFDVIYHLMFGIDPESLKRGKESVIMPWLRSWRPTFNYKELLPQLEKWGPSAPGIVGKNFRNVQKWKMYAVDIVRSFRQEGKTTPFLSRVLDGIDESLGRPLTDSELAEECMGGMFGGSGTTANTFVFALWGTLRHPDVVRCLKNELKDAFPDTNVIPSAVECGKLPYLNAVLQETLRLYPTIIAILPRMAVQDTVLAGAHIPKGANVGIQNLTIHRNEQIFSEPKDFCPERWLQPNEAQRTAFVPFSVGPRKCIGSNLAEMELRVLIAAFFRRFNASIDPSMTEREMELYDGFSASPIGGRLLLHLEKENS
ncbi:hypothetical protein N7494_007327 [Penicillium frequentans]|uniref:Cytochrome P450 n=1 Tax=Penicillium frequentans TaxID=3151616 RepID=A0AAD6CSN0_9EURO|nr:hypothetical protein N7494_007327 [Penicillium glabrum]